MKRLLFVAFALPLFSGCLGAQTNKGRAGESETREAAMRAQARRDRMKIRDLENQVTNLKGGLARHTPVPVEEPLPVEVREPVAEDNPGDPYEQVMGVDDDGVEIVYVGEAANDNSVRAVLSDQTAPLPRRRSRSVAALRPALEPVPTVTDTIPVTRSRVPSLRRQVARGAVATAASSAKANLKPKAVSSTRRQSPKLAYQEAMKSLGQRKHELAETAFRDFLSKYPRHDFADNAQYWLGETYYDRKMYREALVEFGRVLSSYPRGNKAAAAILKRGYCYLALGNAEKARQELTGLINKFPSSAPAKLAHQRLQEI